MTTSRKAIMAAPVFEAAGFYLLRAPLLPADTVQHVLGQDGPELDARRDGAARALTSLAGSARVAQALRIASPDLTRALARDDGRPGTGGRAARRTRRLRSSLLRYITRMSTRPTPYGLFAGVAAGALGDGADVRLREDPVGATRTRADCGWLLALIKDLEQGPALDTPVLLEVNAQLHRAGGRAVLHHADVHGESDGRYLDVQVGAAAEIVLDAARAGVTEDVLVDRLLETLPGTTRPRAHQLIAQLRDAHLLVSDLRPATSEVRPERHLADRLGAGHPAGRGLRRFCAVAAEVDAARGRAAPAVLDELAATAVALTPGYRGDTFHLDTVLATAGDLLPAELGAAAAATAEVLCRVGGAPGRPHHIVEYHAAFLERYGVDGEVPLLELLGPEQGLGPPTTYDRPRRSFPLTPVPRQPDSRRDAVLLGLLAEAVAAGHDVVELTDERVALLSSTSDGAPALPPSLDVHVQVLATSLDALRSGDWTMAVAPVGLVDGGRTFGRFAHLLPRAVRDRLAGLAADEERLDDGVVFAELSFVSPHGRGGNVALRPVHRQHEIAVNVGSGVPERSRIALADVVVGATGERFYLRSARLPGELRVVQGHVLSPLGAPNACRLLLELSQDGTASPTGWDWGAAAAAPFLPRVVRGRVVLQPAQWNLTAARLLGDASSSVPGPDAFHDAVARWRARWRVPRHVAMTWADNRLLLDLQHPACTDELRTELARVVRDEPLGRVALLESSADPARQWLADPVGRRYTSELVIPVRAVDAEPVRRTAVPPAPPVAAVGAARRAVAGAEWTCLQLYAPPARQDDLIVEALPQLVDELGPHGLDRWFFIRYYDPFPHVRLRFRAASPANRAGLRDRCLDWGHRQVVAGLASDLALVSYHREVERYGGPLAIDRIEAVFEACSTTSVALLRAMRVGGLRADLVAVAALEALYRDWAPHRAGQPDRDGIGEAAELPVSDGARAEFRALRGALTAFASAWPGPPGEHPVSEIHAALQGGRPPIQEGARHVRGLREAGRLRGTEASILASLAHMRFNRLRGVDPEAERRCHEVRALMGRAVAGRVRAGVGR
jgi:lantibiotic biosynthesis protein